MKKIAKFICSALASTLLIPVTIGLSICLIWWVFPAFQTTAFGQILLQTFTKSGIILVSIGLSCCLVLFSILTRVFNVITNSKITNFCLHLLTWLLGSILIIETLYTFFAAKSLQTAQFELTLTRKICLSGVLVMMLLYCCLHKKFSKLVDRKLQAYDTAKELNANGRSSVIWVNILKTLDFIFPEIHLLLALCFAFNFEISLYFIMIMLACTLPIIGNMICDKRVKKEAIAREADKLEAQIGATAEAVVDLLSKQLEE